MTYRGSPITLAAKEYELLELFLRNPEQIFSLDRNFYAIVLFIQRSLKEFG